MTLPAFHDELLRRVKFYDGHADTLGALADATFLHAAASALGEPWRNAGVHKVAAVEARGFALGGAVALTLDAGFVAIRKHGPLHPGPKVELRTPPDWRGREDVLRLQRHAVRPGDRVLVVDDWAETGSKALTARRLIETCGGEYVGLSLLVDQLPPAARLELEPVWAAALATELAS